MLGKLHLTPRKAPAESQSTPGTKMVNHVNPNQCNKKKLQGGGPFLTISGWDRRLPLTFSYPGFDSGSEVTQLSLSPDMATALVLRDLRWLHATGAQLRRTKLYLAGPRTCQEGRPQLCFQGNHTKGIRLNLTNTNLSSACFRGGFRNGDF